MLKKNKKPNKKVDYEQLGKMMENIYQSGYIDRNQLYKMSFLKGLVTGLGGVVGATIVVGLLLWFLSIFDTLPLIGPFLENLQQTLESKNQTL